MDALALNAIAKLSLAGFESARPNEMTVLTRSTMPEDLIKPVIYHDKPDSTFYAEFQPRLPSTQPPPGHGELKATLGAYIGHGHSSVVYALDNITVSGVSSPVYVPSLVVKVARLNRVTSLMREAWFYDEMEVLQGVSLARCYGYFTVSLDEGSLKKERRKAERMYPHHDGRWQINPVLLWERAVTGPLHQLLEAQLPRTDLLAVMVLEQLGSTLPLGIPVPEDTRSDIIDLYCDMAQLGVANSTDVRLANILRAPQAPPGLPSLPSPFSHQVHSWRVIDLEQALKTNRGVRGLGLDFGSELAGVWEEAANTFMDELDPEDSDSQEDDSDDSNSPESDYGTASE